MDKWVYEEFRAFLENHINDIQIRDLASLLKIGSKGLTPDKLLNHLEENGKMKEGNVHGFLSLTEEASNDSTKNNLLSLRFVLLEYQFGAFTKHVPQNDFN